MFLYENMHFLHLFITLINMLLFVLLLQQKETQESGKNTLGLSAGGPLSRTEVAISGFKSRPKDSGGWLLYFGASFSTDHCDETSKQSSLLDTPI